MPTHSVRRVCSMRLQLVPNRSLKYFSTMSASRSRWLYPKTLIYDPLTSNNFKSRDRAQPVPPSQGSRRSPPTHATSAAGSRGATETCCSIPGLQSTIDVQCGRCLTLLAGIWGLLLCFCLTISYCPPSDAIPALRVGSIKPLRGVRRWNRYAPMGTQLPFHALQTGYLQYHNKPTP